MDSWRVWTLMAAELENLKRWCWEREFEVILDFVKLCTLLYWSYLSHVCRNSRWSWESATKPLHDNVGEVHWSDCGDLLGVKSGTTAIAGGVVSSIELLSYAEHQSGSRRKSTNVCESRQVVRQQACRPLLFISNDKGRLAPLTCHDICNSNSIKHITRTHQEMR